MNRQRICILMIVSFAIMACEDAVNRSDRGGDSVFDTTASPIDIPASEGRENLSGSDLDAWDPPWDPYTYVPYPTDALPVKECPYPGVCPCQNDRDCPPGHICSCCIEDPHVCVCVREGSIAPWVYCCDPGACDGRAADL